MKQKRWISLLLAVTCLFVLTAGMLTGCGGSKVQVSFDLNYEDASDAPAAMEVKVGKAYGQLPTAPEREGFTFGGWFLDSDCEEDQVTAESIVEEETDHTLYALWIGDKVTVSFDLQGGCINGLPVTEEAVVTVGKLYSMMAIPDDPELENYNFMGWFYDAEGTDGPVTASTRVVKTQDHTLYAVWQEVQMLYDFEKSTDIKVFDTLGTGLVAEIAEFNGSNQLKITNPGDAQSNGTITLWQELKAGTLVTMDVTFSGELPDGVRMWMHIYGADATGWAYATDAIDLTLSETHRKWHHGNGYRYYQSGGTGYYGDHEDWTAGDTVTFEMLVMEDCYGVCMNLDLGNGMESGQWNNNAIYIDNLQFTPDFMAPEDVPITGTQEKPQYVDETAGLEPGVMGTSSYGVIDTGLHFVMVDNGLPYDTGWNIYYDATTEKNVKLIRDGKVSYVAIPGNDNICKFEKTIYFLKWEPWTIGDCLPVQTTDIFIVEGDFIYEENVLTIKKSYIYHDGSKWVCTTKLPDELTPDSEEVDEGDPGLLRGSVNGATDTGIYFTMLSNDLPYDKDWNIYYDATTSDNVKMIRDGKTHSIARVGTDNICKFGAKDYYLRLENYTIGDYAPFSNTDIFVVEGDFVYEENVLSVSKTYIYHDGTNWIFAAELPEDLQPDEGGEEETDGNNAGVLAEHYGGVNIDSATNSVKGIYATGAATNATYNSDWSVEYTPAAAENYKLIRDGKTYNVGVTGQGTIVLFGKTDMYLKQEGHTFGDGTLLPIRSGDVLVVEGEWICNQDASSKITITTTYILIGEGTATFSADAPEGVQPPEEGGNSAGVLSAHSAGGTNTGFHAIGAENTAPYDWAAEYAPSSKECIRLIRNGQTIYREEISVGAIVKFSATEYYVKFDTWIDPSNYPLQAGDVIIIEGTFIGTGNYAAAAGKELKIDKTYICYDGSTFTFSADAPEGVLPEEGGNSTGVLSAHNNGVNIEGGVVKGIYAIGAATDATYDDKWSVEYTPAAAANFKLIRNGVTYDVGTPGSGTLVKISQIDYYLKFEAWTVAGNLLPLREGDVLVVEGEWNCNQDANSVISITKTYITIRNGDVVFSATL